MFALGEKGQLLGRNLVVGVAMIMVTIVIVGYATSEILGAITPADNSLGAEVKSQVEEKFPTIFTLLILVAIIAVIMVVLRAIGAI